MEDLQKVRVQLYDENDNLIGDVDVLTSADCVTFSDGETFQQKLDAGKLKGAQGIKGATGAAGAAATIAIGTVTTGAAGSNAVVTNAGTANDAVFNFTIPKGATGNKGENGQRGSQAFTGTGITGTNTNAAVFSDSGVSSALVGDLYINTSTGNLYQCTLSGAASVANWVYKGTFKGPTGAQGPAGANGAPGAKGDKGDKGDPGDTIRVGSSFASAQQRKLFLKVIDGGE